MNILPSHVKLWSSDDWADSGTEWGVETGIKAEFET